MTKNIQQSMIIDGRAVPINGERNVLELCRKANIEIPSFCYHSHLSIYGACRLCMVDVEGRGIQTSCTLKPEPGLSIKTSTQEIREIRKVNVELLLASHDYNCTTCSKSGACKLQTLARRLGVEEVRYKTMTPNKPLDTSSPAIVINPNRCVLCGDCVRACKEIQSVGAIDFAYRGADTCVTPAFGKDLEKVECVYCGQCASVCPTGAITIKSEVERVWEDIDSGKTVVAQIAPAVRVAIGESLGYAPGTLTTGQIVAALRRIGFDKVYDTSFAADMTVVEEATEFLQRKEKGENLPIFTSCCPGWVKFAEQYFPELLNNLSSCRSPQQMFGSMAKKVLPESLGVKAEDLVVVAIMPCSAKKFEAKRQEFISEVGPEVDHVLTTQELVRMIEEKGLNFGRLEPESLDMPLGFKTGAGVIFGTTGGVSEAVLRYAAEKVGGIKEKNLEFKELRREEGVREVSVRLGDQKLKLGVAHGLANARILAEKVRSGESDYDIIEVMACPGGCVGGAGQPVTFDPEVRKERAKGLYDADRMMQLHNSQDNHLVNECYEKHIGEPGGEKAHELLHTHYKSRRRILEDSMSLIGSKDAGEKLQVKVCVGTNCYLKGSQAVLKQLVEYIECEGLEDVVDVSATFCFEQCGASPNARVGETMVSKCSFESIVKELEVKLGVTA